MSLNPGSAFIWMISGVLQLRNGAPHRAAEHLETAIRLDPLSGDNGISRMYLAVARFQQILIDHHISAFVRKNRGNDISAACGQLKKKWADVAPQNVSLSH